VEPLVGHRSCRDGGHGSVSCRWLHIGAFAILLPMPDSLYEQDILAWSNHQADLLRRLARGERVNDVDWARVVEEIEDVGLSELNAVRSHLRLMLVQLLKVYGWPVRLSVAHWREEIAAFQAEAAQRFAPSMRQRIDLDRLYAAALKQVGAADCGRPPAPWPAECPCSVDQLLNDEVAPLGGTMAAATQRLTGAGEASG
jgi:hypothetical protein